MSEIWPAYPFVIFTPAVIAHRFVNKKKKDFIEGFEPVPKIELPQELVNIEIVSGYRNSSGLQLVVSPKPIEPNVSPITSLSSPLNLSELTFRKADEFAKQYITNSFSLFFTPRAGTEITIDIDPIGELSHRLSINYRGLTLLGKDL